MQFDGYDRLGIAAVVGDVGLIRNGDTISVHQVVDADILGGRTWSPSLREEEFVSKLTSTASGRIRLAEEIVKCRGFNEAVRRMIQRDDALTEMARFDQESGLI